MLFVRKWNFNEPKNQETSKSAILLNNKIIVAYLIIIIILECFSYNTKLLFHYKSKYTILKW